MIYDLYRKFEEYDDVYSILDVVKTTCALCGSPMEWDIIHDFDDKTDQVFLYAEAHCCGFRFYTEHSYSDGNEIYTLRCDGNK